MDENLSKKIEEVNVKFNSMESRFNSKLDPIFQALNEQHQVITELEEIADTSSKTTKQLLSENAFIRLIA